MVTKQTQFILAIALQVAVILAIIVFKLSILSGGTEVLLRIEPVDPRDWLRGDYATFEYDISWISSIYEREQISRGDTVYVVLEESGGYWSARGIYKNKPSESRLFIRGNVQNTGSRIHIVYGIEEYFIPEGTGRDVNFGNTNAAARVAVDEDGNAVLKEIYVSGEPWP